MEKRKKKILGISLCIGIPLCVLLMIYIIVAVYFSNRFYPGTWINGVNCSNKTISEVKDDLAEYHSNYTLRISERNGDQEVIAGSDIGYQVTFDSVRDIKKEQGMWNWLFSLIDVNFYTAEGGSGFEPDMLKTAVSKLNCVTTDNIQEPEDARIDFTDGIKVIPEVPGNKVDEERLYDAVAQAVAEGRARVDIDEAGCYVAPKVTMESKEFQEMMAPIKKITDVTITLTIGPNTEVIDKSVTENWLYEDENGTIRVDSDKVLAYMKEIEDRYSTWGNAREFKTSYGSTITVAAGGTYGWSVDAEGETEKIIEELEAGEDVNREILYDATAQTWEGNEIGNTYVEISISGQHMWFYKNGQLLVETDIVTGNVNKGHHTPVGTFRLNNKQMNVTLVSTQVDDPYESKVTFWLPFKGNAYGIHDASWRSSYGGSIYLYNGSHGCVNTPYSRVQEIYNNIDIGTPVVIY